MDDLDLSRDRRDGRDRDRPFRAAARHPAMLGRVVTAAPAVGKFMKVMPRGVLGSEAEGGAGSAADLGTATRLVYLAGPGVPATGDEVVCRNVGHRWVARRRAVVDGVVACGCTIPTTLHGTWWWDMFPTLPPASFSFDLTYVPGSITLYDQRNDQPFVVTGGYWKSACVDQSATTNCYNFDSSGHEAQINECLVRYVYCGCGYVAKKSWAADEGALCAAETPTSSTHSQRWTTINLNMGASPLQCSPFLQSFSDLIMHRTNTISA